MTRTEKLLLGLAIITLNLHLVGWGGEMGELFAKLSMSFAMAFAVIPGKEKP